MLLLRAHVLALGHSGVRPALIDLMVPDAQPGCDPRGAATGFAGGVRRPGAARQPGASDDRPRRGAHAGGRHRAGGGGDGARRARAADVGAQGGPRARQRHAGHAGGRDLGGGACGVLGSHRRCRGSHDDRSGAGYRCAIRRAAAARCARIPDSRRALPTCDDCWPGSPILASHRDSQHLVQDAYSLRCAPQVHGATRDALAYAGGVLSHRIGQRQRQPHRARRRRTRRATRSAAAGTSTGNRWRWPWTRWRRPWSRWPRSASVASTGCSMSSSPTGCRRSWCNESGLNSGFMLVQYTAASLVSESKSLAHPASVDSIPSSAGQEDHVSMGMTSARHARDVVANAETVVALEALGAAQALDLRAPLVPGAATSAVRDAIRRRGAVLRGRPGVRSRHRGGRRHGARGHRRASRGIGRRCAGMTTAVRRSSAMG